MGFFVSRVSVCLELALPYLRVMLSLERRGENDMSKHHAIYMRVSTKRQDTASQEPELKRWAQSHDGDSCWYHDSYTGTSMDRPGFRKLVKDMETGQVDTLVVWRLDRLGRTAKGLTSLFEDLIRWKVNLIRLKDGLDLVTPAGRDGEHRSGRSCGLRDRGPSGKDSRGPGRGEGARYPVGWLDSRPPNPGHGRTDRGHPCLRSEGGEIAAIARATGLSRPTIYRILAEDCNASSGFSDGESVGRVVCGTGPV